MMHRWRASEGVSSSLSHPPTLPSVSRLQHHSLVLGWSGLLQSGSTGASRGPIHLYDVAVYVNTNVYITYYNDFLYTSQGCVVVEWFKALDWRCEGRGFKSRHGTNILRQDINLHLLLSTQVLKWVPGRMWPSLLVKQFLSVKSRLAGMLPREWRLCTQCVQASTESNDRGNSISVKRLETSKMY